MSQGPNDFENGRRRLRKCQTFLKMGVAGCDGAFGKGNKVSQRAKVCFEMKSGCRRVRRAFLK